MRDEIRILALDLDGTLLDSEKRLSEVNRKALAAAAVKGLLVVPTTGRFFGMMPPAVRDLPIPRRLSDNVTLSTMHGCPPDEIGKIAAYLIEERGLHTNVKLNPTLLGPERLRGILNGTCGFRQVTVPDEAFGHDLK